MSTGESPLRPVELADFAVSQETLLDAAEFEAPSCLVYTNYPVLEPTAGGQHLNNLYVARNHQLNAITLGKLPQKTDLAVIGGEDFIPLADGHVLAEQMPPYWKHDDVPTILGASRPRIDVDGRAVLIGRYGLRTWGHWLGEILPKLVCIETAFPGKYRYVLPEAIFSDPVLRPLLESIWYYGIDLARIVPVQPNTDYRFSELYAVSPAWTRNKLHPGAVELMRAHMLPPRETAPRKVAFLRTESNTRNIVNISAIIAELMSRGFAMIEVGTLPFADQIATFAAADTVVAVLGSGLTGLPYSPLGVRVLTLAPARWSDLFFFALMQTRDAKLADIRGPQDPTDKRPPAQAKFMVELGEVRRGLQELAVS
jgi:capsular polysaccharide biosynthesis protein